MQGADYLIVAVIGASVVVGALRGFVREVVAVASWLVAIWAAWHFSGFLHPYLGGALETPEEKAWVARGIVLLLVLLAGALVGAILSWITRTAAGLSAVDRLFGVVFGFTRGVILVGFGAMLGQTLDLQQEGWWKHARLAPYAVNVASWLESFSGESRHLARRILSQAVPRGEERG